MASDFMSAGFFRLNVSVGRRARGETAVIRAAYIARLDVDRGVVRGGACFAHRSGDVAFCEQFVPSSAPDWTSDIVETWRRHD
jgi:hypothetical protein